MPSNIEISLDVISHFNLSNFEIKQLVNRLSSTIIEDKIKPPEMTELELYSQEVERQLKSKMFMLNK